MSAPEPPAVPFVKAGQGRGLIELPKKVDQRLPCQAALSTPRPNSAVALLYGGLADGPCQKRYFKRGRLRLNGRLDVERPVVRPPSKTVLAKGTGPNRVVMYVKRPKLDVQMHQKVLVQRKAPP